MSGTSATPLAGLVPPTSAANSGVRSKVQVPLGARTPLTVGPPLSAPGAWPMGAPDDPAATKPLDGWATILAAAWLRLTPAVSSGTVRMALPTVDPGDSALNSTVR